ncbi:Sua5/YciO/YrdC/YwlC family protein [Helicobacter suis]|uniref:Sua5/YciO/YrdC/YwlC family protein n=1 Tax=Helicobacter suis TaxID=104628 RepID=UPI001F07590D|nr:Sua5/YciO/YrdC/YwlC family protein [Helicobacter suis]
MDEQSFNFDVGVILAQSDTTVGFFSHSADTLNRVKKSPPNKPLLQTLPSLKALPKRVPLHARSLVRRLKATFVYPSAQGSKAFRVVYDPQVLLFLEQLGPLFSTSANLSAQAYNAEIAKQLADIIIEDSRGLAQKPSSKIIKLGRRRKRRLR